MLATILVNGNAYIARFRYPANINEVLIDTARATGGICLENIYGAERCTEGSHSAPGYKATVRTSVTLRGTLTLEIQESDEEWPVLPIDLGEDAMMYLLLHT